MGLEQEDRMEMLKAEWDFRKENERLGNTEGYERDMTKFYWDQVDQTVGGFEHAMNSGYAPPEAQYKAWIKLQQDLAAISADKTKTPVAKAQAAYEASRTFTPIVSVRERSQRVQSSSFAGTVTLRSAQMTH